MDSFTSYHTTPTRGLFDCLEMHVVPMPSLSEGPKADVARKGSQVSRTVDVASGMVYAAR